MEIVKKIRKRQKAKDVNGNKITVGTKVHYIVSGANGDEGALFRVDAINEGMLTIRPCNKRKDKSIDVPEDRVSTVPFVFDVDKNVIFENASCAVVNSNGVEMIDDDTFEPVRMTVEKIVSGNGETVVVDGSGERLSPSHIRMI